MIPDQSRKYNILIFLMSLLVCIGLITASDIILGRIRDSRKPVVKRVQDIYKVGTEFDENLGYRVRPNLALPVTKYANGEPVYAVVYHTDRFGRRVVPESSNRNDAQKFIAFFGCSFTFGEGVQDEETLPNLVAREMPDYMVYNYGVFGYGPQHLLRMVETGFVNKTIPQRKGIIVYSMFFDHINRAVGRMNIILMNGRHFPYYQLQEGNLVFAGHFDRERTCLHRLMSLVNKSGIVRYFNLNFPPLREKDFETTARMITETKRLLSKQFEEIEFYILVYPTIANLNRSIAPMYPYLSDNSITVLDFYDMPYDRSIHALHMKYDFHPSPLLHKIMSEKLLGTLKKTEHTSR